MSLRSLAFVDLGPLRRWRDLRLLVIGRTVSMFGNMITMVAVPFQVWRLTHSALDVGLLGLAELGPLLALAFVGGALADAHDRRRMVQATEGALALMAGLLAVNASLRHSSLAALYVLAAAMSGATAVQRPSLDALLPRLVDRDELASAAAVWGVSGSAAMVGGPALAGVLLSTIGTAATYGVDVATFGVSLVALAAMNAVPAPADAERPSLRRVAEGLRYARSRPDLLGTYIVDFVAMLFGMPTALFPALADRLGGTAVLGLLYAAPAAGALVASATSGWSRHVRRHGAAIATAAAGWGVAIVVFGLAHQLWLALFGLAVAGGADMISGLFRQTMWNQSIPDDLRGRLASIELLSYSTGPLLGNVESGSAAAVIGVQGAVVSGGLLCIAGVAVAAAAIPALRHYDAGVVLTESAG